MQTDTYMKGIVFTEFLGLVEEKFGYEMVDQIIEESTLPSGGAYTAVGTYAHAEIVSLVTNLSRRTDLPVGDLLKIYGRHLFGVFVRSYGHFLARADSAFSLLESIENHIHVEVKKLYPDAELPHFETKRLSPGTLEMVYRSERRMGDFAEGLLEATFEHFKENATIERENLVPDGSVVRFLLQKSGGAA